MTATKHCYYTYTIDEHPNPEACFDWMRQHWDLTDYCIDECMSSLKGFCNFFQVNLKDWAVSALPDRGEFVTVRVCDELEELKGVRLWKYLTNNFEAQHPGYLSGECPFTGMTYDESALDPMREFMAKPDDRDWQTLVDDCIQSLIEALHLEGEYRYTDEALREDCIANEWEFNESGVPA